MSRIYCVKDLRDGSIVTAKIRDLTKRFEVSVRNAYSRINNKNFVWDRYFVVYLEGTQAPDVSLTDKIKYVRAKLLLQNIYTGKVTRCASVTEACAFIGIKDSRMYNWLRDPDESIVRMHTWRVKIDDGEAFTSASKLTLTGLPIVVTNKRTGETSRHYTHGAVACATGVDRNTVRRRLNNLGTYIDKLYNIEYFKPHEGEE